MSTWKEALTTDNATWRAVVDYANVRIDELTAICVEPQSDDKQIRQAQSGILELQRLIGLPTVLRAEAQIRAHGGARKGY